VTNSIASFAAGCFWGVEARFREIPGVIDAPVGYMGGHVEQPDYRNVCSGATGHAEAVQITFDPGQVSYEQLLTAFFEMHNPTTMNRQGPDRGTQYRSAVFYHDDEQKEQALRAIQNLNDSGSWQNPVVTEVSPASRFWPAEEYHQRYLEKNGGGFCHV
jgi:peptide-methionine (S)-S-oxide reductase